MWKKAGLSLVGLLMLASSACKPNEVDKYAQQLNLPKEDRAIVRQLGYDGMDANEKALIDELYSLPQSLQIHEKTLNYLKGISEDKKVDSGEIAGLYDLDHDIDELSLKKETEMGTDPSKPNPNVKYALDKNLPYAVQFKDLDDNGNQEPNEKTFIDLVSGYSEEQAKKIIGLAKDGISDEEIRALNYLPKIPPTYKNPLLDFGLDGDAAIWLNLISTFDRMYANELIKNKLCIQDYRLTELERKILQNPGKYDKELFDEYMAEIAKKSPEIHKELLLLPDFKQIEVKDVEVAEDLIALTDYKTVGTISFDSLFNEGIKDKRKYCAPLEALVWILYDKEKEDLDKEPWEKYKWMGSNVNTISLICAYSWKESSISSIYKSDRWRDFNNVVNRLNSPRVLFPYMLDQIKIIPEPYGTNYEQSAIETFDKMGGDCEDHAEFARYCLKNNGYEAYMLIYPLPTSRPMKHAVCLCKENDLLYFIDERGIIDGPYNTIEDILRYRSKDGTYELR